jgi:hypothetical protein
LYSTQYSTFLGHNVSLLIFSSSALFPCGAEANNQTISATKAIKSAGISSLVHQAE